MDFADRTLVRLADANERAALLGSSELERVLRTAYDADSLGLSGPFAGVFDRVDLGGSLSRSVELDGHWARSGTAERTEARMELRGLAVPGPTVDALWEGAVVARASADTATVTAVEVDLPDVGGVDDAVVADLGALPDDPAALDAARRAVILERLRATLDQPGAVGDAHLDSLFRSVGADDAGSFLHAMTNGATVPLRISFSDSPTGPLSPRRLPITALVLIRDVGFSLTGLLHESRQALDHLRARGAAPPPDPGLPRRHGLLALWLVPESVLDDDDWPGGGSGSAAARRTARAEAAAAWLSLLGIVLVPVSA